LSETKDIESRNVDKMLKSMFVPKWLRWKLIRKTSRDNARTPMQWNCDENAGFTTGTPWLQVNRNYLTVNTESDRRDGDGIYAFYRNLIRMRANERIFLEGDFVPVSAKNNIYIYKRILNGNAIICIFNFSKKAKKIKPAGGKVLLSNYGKTEQDGVMKPYEFIAVKEE
jgi:oligo-1,6-glucosidase